MADFCKQCSERVFGEDFRDLEGLCEEGQTVQLICEGCGNAEVDHEGVCINPDCWEHHGR